VSGEIPVVEAGVAFVVRDDGGRVLLHRRAEEDGWSPPSGTLRGGEKIGAALEREIEEETGLDVEMVRLVAIHSDPEHQVIRTTDGQLTHFITCVFTCRSSGGELRPNGEAPEWAWFEPERLPALTAFARAYLEDALREGDEVAVR
jgi:ADP-ribose pyrophosphatase YjhB (NUDIX family)